MDVISEAMISSIIAYRCFKALMFKGLFAYELIYIVIHLEDIYSVWQMG